MGTGSNSFGQLGGGTWKRSAPRPVLSRDEEVSVVHSGLDVMGKRHSPAICGENRRFRLTSWRWM